MPPIRVFSDAPLHPDGVTPQTAPPEEQPTPTPTRTTVISPSDPSLPPPPQPGARPQPGPVPTAGPSNFADPPAPQPGAVPHPHGHHVTATHTTIATGWALPQTPSQFNIPAPIGNYAPTHSTSYIPQPSPYETGGVATLSGAPIGGGLPARKNSLEHPPGYVQNPYAADGTAADRARLTAAARQAHAEEGVLGSVKNWVSGAGETLGKLEGDAWKWAQGKQ